MGTLAMTQRRIHTVTVDPSEQRGEGTTREPAWRDRHSEAHEHLVERRGLCFFEVSVAYEHIDSRRSVLVPDDLSQPLIVQPDTLELDRDYAVTVTSTVPSGVVAMSGSVAAAWTGSTNQR